MHLRVVNFFTIQNCGIEICDVLQTNATADITIH